MEINPESVSKIYLQKVERSVLLEELYNNAHSSFKATPWLGWHEGVGTTGNGCEHCPEGTTPVQSFSRESRSPWEARLYPKEGGSQYTAASSSLSSTGRQPSCQRYLFAVSTDRWPCKTEIHTSPIQNKNKRTESMSQPPAPSEKRWQKLRVLLKLVCFCSRWAQGIK